MPAQQLLADGGSALDAVCLAVDLLEDCPLFNAGHGAVFTHAETHELDAAVMDGATLRAGAVACVSRVRRPLRAARAVMERSEHVLLVGAGAEAFAAGAGPGAGVARLLFDRQRAASNCSGRWPPTRRCWTTTAPPWPSARRPTTRRRWTKDRSSAPSAPWRWTHKGNLAAATSTGGMTNKRSGRVGDSPLIGAGTYADNRTAAISCTGTGEMFIRAAAAYDICARMAYAGVSLDEAAREVVMNVLPAIGGRGGLIAVDAQGNLSLPFNTEGMYRGWARVGEVPVTRHLCADARRTDRAA